MRNKTARALRRVCVDSDGALSRARYRTLKKNWNRVPWTARRPLLEALKRFAQKTVQSSQEEAATTT